MKKLLDRYILASFFTYSCNKFPKRALLEKVIIKMRSRPKLPRQKMGGVNLDNMINPFICYFLIWLVTVDRNQDINFS